MKKILAALLFAVGAAHAQEAVLSGFLSNHFGDGRYESHNHGIGYRSDDGYAGLCFLNSLRHTSCFAGLEVRTSGTVRLGVVAGVVTGYDDNPMPIALPEVVFTHGRVELAALYVPGVANRAPAIGVQLRLLLDKGGSH